GIVLLATQNRSQGGNLGLYVLVLHRLQSMRGELGHALEVEADSFSNPLRPSPLHLSPQPLNLPKGAGSEVGLVCDKSCCTMLDSLGQPSQLLILLGRQAQPRRAPRLAAHLGSPASLLFCHRQADHSNMLFVVQ